MNLQHDLTDDNFILFCTKYYDNPSTHTDDEFWEDLRRIKYIKKLLTRFKTNGELKDRLILNHLIVLSNVFGIEPLSKIIWLKMADYLPQIKPFMLALGILPDYVTGVCGKTYITDDVPLDINIVAVLRKIKES